MKAMQRISITAMALALGTLFATSLPLTAKPGTFKNKPDPGWNTTELINVGDEPQATGEVTWGKPILESGTLWPPIYSYQVTVKCQNLTPGATYLTPVGTFTTNKKGNGMITGRMIMTSDWRDLYYVERLNPDGSTTPVLGW